jgi:3-deoxy-D-manno-octulosonic-acid transferase
LNPILDVVRPRLFVFVETEIWPSLLLHLGERRVGAVMVNASVSHRSYERYKHVHALIAAALGTLAAVCVRDRESYGRLLALGADPARTTVSGDLKSDALGDESVAHTPDVLATLEGDGPVLLAVSTHEGEDALVLAAFSRVRARHPRVRLVLAPRHPERAPAARRIAEARALVTGMWSQGRPRGRWDVLIVDTTGELRGFMKSATSAFVGGSWVEVGGHNLLEPAAFGLPLATGPFLEEVRDQADLLRAAGALAIVAHEDELAAQWTAWLDAPRAARDRGERARAAARSRGGALERTWSVLEPLLVEAGVCAPEEAPRGVVAAD